jgi:hypothetical protein
LPLDGDFYVCVDVSGGARNDIFIVESYVKFLNVVFGGLTVGVWMKKKLFENS